MYIESSKLSVYELTVCECCVLLACWTSQANDIANFGYSTSTFNAIIVIVTSGHFSTQFLCLHIAGVGVCVFMCVIC